jgi:hypothetical protein
MTQNKQDDLVQKFIYIYIYIYKNIRVLKMTL